MKFTKIKHPWWHWFFTDMISWSINGDWMTYRCTRCKVEYTIYPLPSEKYKRVEVRQ